MCVLSENQDSKVEVELRLAERCCRLFRGGLNKRLMSLLRILELCVQWEAPAKVKEQIPYSAQWATRKGKDCQARKSLLNNAESRRWLYGSFLRGMIYPGTNLPG